ncbi:DUF1905 domain-containing protein [Nocardia sp. NPDC020380]|uniref:DUF1905 domain-containing protein n=1 Tax=Nocardia sp. NPDC020380 TaxID=3364309 RepID=UPI0037AFB0CC
MAESEYAFTAELWEWESQASWYFVSLPEAVADDIDAFHGHKAAGFGSVRVKVTVGATRWATSIFPDKSRATYVLPVKKSVRTAEGLAPGKPVELSLEIA